MTREEQLACLKDRPCSVCKMRTDKGCISWECVFEQTPDEEKEPCDCISREEVCDYIAEFVNHEYATDRERELVKNIIDGIQHLPSIQPKPKTECSCEQIKWERDVAIEQLKELGYGLGEKPRIGHCKECKNFEYNSVAKIDEIPLIVAHEICKKWGDGCKTNENGYCFLFEPRESEDKE